MSEKLKEKLKELARKDKVRFLNAVAYYVLAEQIDKDPELKKMVLFLKGVANVDLNEVLRDVLDKALTEKPNIVNLGLGIAMLVGYISNRLDRR